MVVEANYYRMFEPDVDELEEFREDLERKFEEWNVCSELKSKFLLGCLDEKTYQKIKSDLPVNASYRKICRVLDKHFPPRRITREKRQQYFRTFRTRNETVTEWHDRLKKLAKGCRFGSKADTIVLEKFTAGLKGTGYHALCQEHYYNMTLKKAFKIALECETKENRPQRKASLVPQENIDDMPKHIQFYFTRTLRRKNNEEPQLSWVRRTDVDDYKEKGRSFTCFVCGNKSIGSPRKEKFRICFDCKPDGNVEIGDRFKKTYILEANKRLPETLSIKNKSVDEYVDEIRSKAKYKSLVQRIEEEVTAEELKLRRQSRLAQLGQTVYHPTVEEVDQQIKTTEFNALTRRVQEEDILEKNFERKLSIKAT